MGMFGTMGTEINMINEYFIMIEHLLVYGTLAPEVNHYMMKISGVWKTAYFKGIVLKDWGKWNGYPGILDNEADEIKGYVFSSKDLKNTGTD